jgi:cytochrome c-type biogenesis protein CcmH/NrfG
MTAADAATLPARVLDALRGGRMDEALALAGTAVAAHPQAGWAWLSLARAQLAAGDLDNADRAAERAAALEPSAGEAALLWAMRCQARGEAATAAAQFERVVVAAPGAPAAWLGLAEARRALGDHAGSRTAFERAVALAPRLGRGWRGLAGAALGAGDTATASAAAERAVALDGGDLEARWLHALALARRGEGAAALAALDALLERAPAHAPARWLHGVTPSAPVAADADAERARVDAYARTLDTLEALPLDAGHARALHPVLANHALFDLPYLLDDVRALQARHGALIARCQSLLGAPDPPPAPPPRARTRVVIATSLAHGHSVMKLFERVLRALDRTTLELFLLHTGPHRDEVTQRLVDAVDGFAQIVDIDAARAQVRAWQPEVMLYTDLGMDPAMLALAARRLAPRQYALWGHPVTTGLASIDAFLAPAAMERDDAQDDYREPLLRLPGLGCDFAWPAEPLPPRAVGDGDAPTLLVAQSIHKLTTRHDALFARVLAAVPGARLHLAPHADPAVVDALRRRLQAALDAAGVRDPQALQVTPFLAEPAWRALLARTDVNLDTLGFSGGITSFELLWHGIPTVTLPGRTLRSRQTLALLRQLDLPELIASDEDDYVRIAVSLARDAARRAALRETLLARRERLDDGGATAVALSGLLRAGRLPSTA